MSDSPILELRQITKSFPGVRALDGVDLSVRPGEVHALLGENGAGKSTLIKIIAGVEVADSGDYLTDGNRAEISEPRHAHDRGVSVVFQELSQVESLSVAENVFFGRLPHGRTGLVDRRALHRRTAQLLHSVGLQVDPGSRLGFLSVAQRQLVEIARALSQNARVIAMDEPTSALSRTEIETLFTLIDRLAADGVGIIYVSHKLDELRRVSHRTTVLRDGRHIVTVPTAETSDGELIRLMVGRQPGDLYPDRTATAGEQDASPVLRLTGASNAMVTDISFTAGAGEIVGFSGLMGSGRTELARLIFGLDPRTAGTVQVGDRSLPSGSSPAAARAGIGYVPEDRKSDGLVLMSTIRENLSVAVLRRISRWAAIDRRRERRLAADAIRDLGIKARSAEQQVAALSGGNQQKVVLARWLIKDDLAVLILDEPTRGIDVNAKSEIYRLITAIAERGVAVVVMSSEMPELLGICDVIHVLADGRVVATYPRAEASQENLMHAALGAQS